MAGKLIDDTGRVWPEGSKDIAKRIAPVPAGVDALAYAVRNLGFIHIASTDGTLVVTLRPRLVSRLAMVGTLDLIARAQPRCVVVCTDAKPRSRENFTNIDLALRRIEDLADGDVGGAFHPLYAAEQQPLEQLGAVAQGQLLPLLQVWTEANARWQPELWLEFGRRNLLDHSILLRVRLRMAQWTMRRHKRLPRATWIIALETSIRFS